MNIKTNSRSGFTIVELLIVIVVIAILAAITIVSYNGITARANTSSALSAAQNTIKKAEAFNADSDGQGYPNHPADLTGADSDEVFALDGVTFTSAQISGTTQPGAPSELNFFACGSADGVRVTYYDYQASTWKQLETGDCSTPTYVGSGATNS